MRTPVIPVRSLSTIGDAETSATFYQNKRRHIQLHFKINIPYHGDIRSRISLGKHFPISDFLYMGCDSSVVIATRYGLDGPRIRSRWGARFSSPVQTGPWCPPCLLYNGYRVFPGEKAAGAWRWLPTPSSAEVKERVQLYIYSTSGPLWPVIRWTSPLPLHTPLCPGQVTGHGRCNNTQKQELSSYHFHCLMQRHSLLKAKLISCEV